MTDVNKVLFNGNRDRHLLPPGIGSRYFISTRRDITGFIASLQVHFPMNRIHSSDDFPCHNFLYPETRNTFSSQSHFRGFLGICLGVGRLQISCDDLINSICFKNKYCFLIISRVASFFSQISPY